MKKTLIACLLSGIFIFLIGFVVSPLTFKAEAKENTDKCTTIQSGLLLNSNEDIITTGYDEWGYNYQAHLFNGWYGNYNRPTTPVTSGDRLIMKWNDAWLSNVSCDGNNLLDRHYPLPSYKGSGAWLTNHMSGTYEDDGLLQKWTYFVKIVAAPEDATLNANNQWVSADGNIIGYAIWGEFAVIQEIYNDTGTGDHGILYKGDAPLGFGFYRP